MQTYPDGIPCFVRQALEAARMATSDEKSHEEVLPGVPVIARHVGCETGQPVAQGSP